MNQNATPQGKHIPQRTCLGCRAAKPKQGLARIVRTAAGRVEVDITGKAQGRGAYFCPNVDCASKALNAKTLSRALRLTLNEATLAELRKCAVYMIEQLQARSGPPQTKSLP